LGETRAASFRQETAPAARPKPSPTEGRATLTRDPRIQKVSDGGESVDVTQVPGSELRRPLVVSVSLPEYRVDTPPDYRLGKRVDRVLREHFDVNEIVVRAISSFDHPSLSLDQLADRIAATGTDKYDPVRKGVAYEEFAPYRPDFHGGPYGIDHDMTSFFGGIMRHFYEDAPTDRGYPLRIDLLLIYDRSQLVQAEKVDPEKPSVRPPLESFLFRFKYPERKKEALLGLIKIR